MGTDTHVKLERREAKQRKRRAALVILAPALAAFLFVSRSGGSSDSHSDAPTFDVVGDGGSSGGHQHHHIRGSRKGGGSVAWGGGEAGGGAGARPSRGSGSGAIGGNGEDDDGNDGNDGGDAKGGGGRRKGPSHSSTQGSGPTEEKSEGVLAAALKDTAFGVRVRVFVYTAREVPEVAKLAPTRGCKRAYAEQLLHALLLNHPTLRTKDAAVATHFFLPSYPECLTTDLAMSPPQYTTLMTAALARMPAFRRSGGLDHVLMAPPRGMRSVFPGWRRHAGNCVFFSPEPAAGNGYGGDVFREMVGLYSCRIQC
jgi:hypothetical protein